MSNKMLIDASHPEETRVVVLRGNRVEEFDFEAADRQQLRGNIYLAKVTRVEPSLQAAFIEYGGNRHGFLAFSEIHPDYYQIPYADRQALLQEHAEEAAAEARREDEQARRDAEPAAAEADDAESVPELPEEDAGDATLSDADDTEAAASDDEPASPEASAGTPETDPPEVALAAAAAPESVSAPADSSPAGEENGEHDEPEHEDDAVESVGAEDALEELPERRKPRPRQYKIQEVIKRRQVLLVQVVKEERGNKGAALTTYLSLAGRYSVLMPNTARGGGISRKITTPADRKRLKAIASELDVPEGMGVILRTAGANRTKSEIKRDFEYLLRLWENVRELTLQSTAPKLVYEEGSLIKRAIRDLYSREIEQIVVAGEPAYREAKDFMRMLMPSHARNVQLYKDDTPIFSRNGVEAQLDAMFSPQVTLKSGGYIVINQTEALVSIDVNSGRSTREHSIEDTALNTNLEAAEEIARQLRLRDLAGLIVIDFIDMEEKRNNRSVERRLKDCLRADRARIQVGRISHFGLLEMSRQRIRTGVLESSTVPCPHCRGTGQVRSISSLSLQILRAVEDSLLRHSGHHLIVRTRPEVALYVLNQKRLHLAQLEQRFGVTIAISGDTPENGAGFSVERGAPAEDRAERSGAVAMRDLPPLEVDEDDEAFAEADDEAPAAASGGEREPRRRRRRRRGNGDDRHHRHASEEEHGEEIEEAASPDEDRGERSTAETTESESERDSRRRRRGRRGGKRRGRGRENGNGDRPVDRLAPTSEAEALAGDESGAPSPAEQLDDWGGQDDNAYAGEPAAAEAAYQREEVGEPASAADADTDADTSPEPEPVTAYEPEPVAEPAAPPEDDNRPKRSGWWSRKSSFF